MGLLTTDSELTFSVTVYTNAGEERYDHVGQELY